MEEGYKSIIVPAGNFDVLGRRLTAKITPQLSYPWNLRYHDAYFAKNIGVVLD